MASGNPAFNEKTFQQISRSGGAAMTVTGTISKTAILLLLVILGTTFTWNLSGPLAMPLMFGGMIGGFIVSLITIFKKEWAPVTAPIYSILQGLFLGGISAAYNQQFHGIVLQAVLLTFGVAAAILGLYQTRVIRVTQRLRSIIFAATAGIAIYYVIAMVMSLFGMQAPMIWDTGWLGIGFSVFVVILAAFNLLLDFDLIEQGVAYGAPRYMEWYCSFGIMVTLVWLYLEILRLLSKLQRR
ncbi:MAG: hypothetical protein BGO12_08720 [Verrucomicrobia bacterium 61-8]|nr:Bax inhibitor-1/YccA family protein [Verrucomicrobiota bacterium]OJV10132.1 MAG: hypothetical protein BGO12_08720 [Verrucomicrobia bacterium 61-8]